MTSIFIIFLLVGSLNADVDVFGLILAEDGQFGIESAEMESGDFLVEVLRKSVDLVFVLMTGLVLPELELGEGLVAERSRHDEAGVSGGATQVQETT